METAALLGCSGLLLCWTSGTMLVSIPISTRHGPDGHVMGMDNLAPASPQAHRSVTNMHGCLLINTAWFTAGSYAHGPPSSWLSLFSAPGNGPVPPSPHESFKMLGYCTARSKQDQRESLFIKGPTQRRWVCSRQATRGSRDLGPVAELGIFLFRLIFFCEPERRHVRPSQEQIPLSVSHAAQKSWEDLLRASRCSAFLPIPLLFPLLLLLLFLLFLLVITIWVVIVTTLSFVVIITVILLLLPLFLLVLLHLPPRLSTNQTHPETQGRKSPLP